MLKTYVTCLSIRDRVMSRVREAAGDEAGATVAEYALVLVLVSVAVITVLSSLGSALQDKIAAIVTRIQGTPLTP